MVSFETSLKRVRYPRKSTKLSGLSVHVFRPLSFLSGKSKGPPKMILSLVPYSSLCGGPANHPKGLTFIKGPSLPSSGLASAEGRDTEFKHQGAALEPSPYNSHRSSRPRPRRRTRRSSTWFVGFSVAQKQATNNSAGNWPNANPKTMNSCRTSCSWFLTHTTKG